MSFNPIPTPHSCFRYIGEGSAHGVLQRVIFADAVEVVTVQESREPSFSWLGTLAQFRKQFVFVVGPAPSWKRGTGTVW